MQCGSDGKRTAVWINAWNRLSIPLPLCCGAWALQTCHHLTQQKQRAGSALAGKTGERIATTRRGDLAELELNQTFCENWNRLRLLDMDFQTSETCSMPFELLERLVASGICHGEGKLLERSATHCMIYKLLWNRLKGNTRRSSTVKTAMILVHGMSPHRCSQTEEVQVIF